MHAALIAIQKTDVALRMSTHPHLEVIPVQRRMCLFKSLVIGTISSYESHPTRAAI